MYNSYSINETKYLSSKNSTLFKFYQTDLFLINVQNKFIYTIKINIQDKFIYTINKLTNNYEPNNKKITNRKFMFSSLNDRSGYSHL